MSENFINFEKLWAIVKTKNTPDPKYTLDDVVSLHTTHDDALEDIEEDESIFCCYVTFTDLTQFGFEEQVMDEDDEEDEENDEEGSTDKKMLLN